MSLRSVNTSEEALGDAGRIRSHLKKVLDSPSFRASERCQTFLEYVVEKVLQGQARSLKERTIAVDVYGRPCDANLAEDTIVRVGAREVRRRLAHYYGTAEAVADEIKIDLPTGTYVPEVCVASPRTAGHGQAAPAAASNSKRFSLYRPIAVVCVLAILGALLYTAIAHAPADPVEAFWSPVFGAGNTILIVVAHPIVYHPSRRAQSLL